MENFTKISFLILICIFLFQGKVLAQSRDSYVKFAGCYSPPALDRIQFCLDTKGGAYVKARLAKITTSVGTFRLSVAAGTNLFKTTGADNRLVIIKYPDKDIAHVYEIKNGKRLELDMEGHFIQTITEDSIVIKIMSDSELKLKFTAKDPVCSTPRDIGFNPIGFFNPETTVQDIKDLLGEPKQITTINMGRFQSDWKELSYEYAGENIVDFYINVDNGILQKIRLYETAYTGNFFEIKKAGECLTQFFGKSRKDIEHQLPASLWDFTYTIDETEYFGYRVQGLGRFAYLLFRSSFATDYICNQITINWSKEEL